LLRKENTSRVSDLFAGCLRMRGCSITAATAGRHAVRIAHRNLRPPDRIKSTVGILPGYPPKCMVCFGIATPLLMCGVVRLSAGLFMRTSMNSMPTPSLNQSGNAESSKGYGSMQIMGILAAYPGHFTAIEQARSWIGDFICLFYGMKLSKKPLNYILSGFQNIALKYGKASGWFT